MVRTGFFIDQLVMINKNYKNVVVTYKITVIYSDLVSVPVS